MERKQQTHENNTLLLRRVLTPATIAVLSYLDPRMIEHSFDNMLLFQSFMNFFDIVPSDAMLRGALLHDIGKIGLDDLMHKKNITDAEKQIMRSHVERGIKLISEVFDSEEVDIQFMAHHERVNGTGYPLGLKGDEIPRHIQAFSIIDAFSAATGNRGYQKKYNPKQAFASIRKDVEKGDYNSDLFEIFSTHKSIWKDHIKQREDAFSYFKTLSKQF